MKKVSWFHIWLVVAIVSLFAIATACSEESANLKDREQVNEQQEHYGVVQPIPSFDYSIPRDVLIQIYNVVTLESRNTYTIIESITGETKYHGPSNGYGIPADTSLTNPLVTNRLWGENQVVEQAEPNGLFSSKNTDGTWVLFVDSNGDVTPVYTEHKVTTFPYAVRKNEDGSWVRADDNRASFTVNVRGRE